MPYSQGCLFVQAYLDGATKKFGDAQLSGTSLTYSGGGTPAWSPSQALLLDLQGEDQKVSTGLLTAVFALTGSGSSGTVTINMATLNSYQTSIPARKAAYAKIWDAFTGNGRIVLTVQTNVGPQDVRIELRALKSANYTLTSSTRSAACVYPSGCSSPDFNFEGESASNFTAQFVVPNCSNLVTAAFTPDNFSIPDGTLPGDGSHPNSQLALTRAFTTDSSGTSVTPYTVASNLPSVLVVS